MYKERQSYLDYVADRVGGTPDELLSGLRALGAKGSSWESLAEEMD